MCEKTTEEDTPAMPGYCSQMWQEELHSSATWRDVLCEMIGTSLLVTVQCALPLTWGTDSLGGVVQIALGMGFVVTALIETFGEFSGANMNPAVTISMVVGKQLTILKGILYIIAQCAGAVAGAALIYGVTPADEREGLATTTVNPKVHPLVGMVVEAWLTAILVFTIWGATNRARRAVFVPSLPIGLAVALDIMAGIKYTGSSMNPARSLGPALMMNIWQHHWVYWLGPIAGGLAATVIYHYVLDRMGPKPHPGHGYQAMINMINRVCAETCSSDHDNECQGNITNMSSNFSLEELPK